MTTFYELASANRQDMIYTKDQLLAPLEEGMLAAPHPMVEGLTARDYYSGKVTGPTGAQAAWVANQGAGVTPSPGAKEGEAP
jgi:NADH-quinone oxidoreductase subunit I